MFCPQRKGSLPVSFYKILLSLFYNTISGLGVLLISPPLKKSVRTNFPHSLSIPDDNHEKSTCFQTLERAFFFFFFRNKFAVMIHPHKAKGMFRAMFSLFQTQSSKNYCMGASEAPPFVPNVKSRGT